MPRPAALSPAPRGNWDPHLEETIDLQRERKQANEAKKENRQSRQHTIHVSGEEGMDAFMHLT